MTKIGTKYNYTFCNTNISGQYIVNGFGNVDGIATVWAYDFIVTPDGTEPSTSQGFLLFAAIISILVFAILFFGIAIKTENMPVKVLFLCLGIIALVFNLGITIVMIQKYFSTGIAINNVFEGFYNLILILGGVALFLFGIGILIYLITAYKKKRGLID